MRILRNKDNEQYILVSLEEYKVLLMAYTEYQMILQMQTQASVEPKNEIIEEKPKEKRKIGFQ
jgi:hypothetical protein